MFSPTSNTQSQLAIWQARVWRAVDRAVAFATLDAYGLSAPHDAVDHRSDLHPRQPLQAPPRPRRPGGHAPRAQLCVTPLEARPRRRGQSSTTERIPYIARGV